MSFSEKCSGIVGKVHPFFLTKTGNRIDIAVRKNTVLDSAHFILSRIMMGDVKYIPSHVGFIHGADDSFPTIAVSSNSGMDDIITGVHGLMLSPVTPVFSAAGVGNRAVFTSNTINWSAYPGWPEASSSAWQYGAMLLSHVADTGVLSKDYVPFSAVGFPSAIEVPEGLNFGVQWDIFFGNEE